MEKEPLITQDALTTRISSFLADHIDGCYTVRELAGEPYISGSMREIQQRVHVLVTKGLLRVKDKHGERCFQVVPALKR